MKLKRAFISSIVDTDKHTHRHHEYLTCDISDNKRFICLVPHEKSYLKSCIHCTSKDVFARRNIFKNTMLINVNKIQPNATVCTNIRNMLSSK